MTSKEEDMVLLPDQERGYAQAENPFRGKVPDDVASTLYHLDQLLRDLDSYTNVDLPESPSPIERLPADTGISTDQQDALRLGLFTLEDQLGDIYPRVFGGAVNSSIGLQTQAISVLTTFRNFYGIPFDKP